MGINDLETFKGLINKFDINDKSQLKVSSMHRFFEEAIGFTSSLINKKFSKDYIIGEEFEDKFSSDPQAIVRKKTENIIKIINILYLPIYALLINFNIKNIHVYI